jgi:hypothetical protein
MPHDTNCDTGGTFNMTSALSRFFVWANAEFLGMTFDNDFATSVNVDSNADSNPDDIQRHAPTQGKKRNVAEP